MGWRHAKPTVKQWEMLIAQGSFEIPDYVMDIVTQLKVIHLPQFNQLLPARWGMGTAFMI